MTTILGRDPWRPQGSNGPFIRQSDEVPAGMQAYWDTTKGGHGILIDHITIPHPELIGKFDTLVLNPVDYEAVKKSMMDTPAKDRIRRDRVRGHGDLRAFDAKRHFYKKVNEAAEERAAHLARSKGDGK